jgi:hypothetical protein
MKKIILLSLIMSFYGYSQFNIEVGYNNTTGSVDMNIMGAQMSYDASANDIYLGASYNITLSETLFIQPALFFGGDMTHIPVSLGYVTSEKLNLLAGLSSLSIAEGGMGIKKSAIGLNLGATYNFSDKIGLNLRYNSDLSNRIEDSEIWGDSELKMSSLKFGLSYTF